MPAVHPPDGVRVTVDFLFAEEVTFNSAPQFLSTHSASPTPPMSSHSGLSAGGHTLAESTTMHVTIRASRRIERTSSNQW